MIQDGPTTTAVRATKMRNAAVLHTPLLEDTLIPDEIELEVMAVKSGVERYRKQAAEAQRRGDGSSLKPAERLLVHWFEIVSVNIGDERDRCRVGEPGRNRGIYGPVLEMVEPEALAVIAMHEAVSACMAEPFGVKTTALCHSIGRAVFAEINLFILAKTNHEAMKEMNRRFRNHLQPWRVNWWARKNTSGAIRDLKAQVHIGAFLLGTLIDLTACGDCADFSKNRKPAFVSEVKHTSGTRRCAFTRLTKECWGIIEDGHAARCATRPRYLPMIVKPYRWSKDAQGGYVRVRTPFIAKPTPTQRAVLESCDLDPIYDHLEAVTCTPHRINRTVLKWQKIVWEQGGNVLLIPGRENIPEPPHPPGYNFALTGILGCWAGVPIEQKRAYKHEAFTTITANRRSGAERLGFLRKHQVADLFVERPKFWYPHQFDFRGRCYPIPPYLNHQTDDVSRGLLEWGEYVDPGDGGHRELLIEAANNYGFDKLSFKDRVLWATDHEGQIAAAARDPLDNDWWHPVFDAQGRQTGGAEKPWQFLAACIALNDPEAAGHATVWRDGTCNGLQHYSALARDPVGAAAVNLLPCDVPADVYADVARGVLSVVAGDRLRHDKIVRFKQRFKRDGAWIIEDRETTFAALADLLYEHVNRRTIKQTVMTNVYGVTLVGASRQIQERLRECGIVNESLYVASQYLARTTLGSIGEVCAGAKLVMDWLRTCAHAIAENGSPVRWTTPIGFPVVQPYRRYKTTQIRTGLHHLEKIVEDDAVGVWVGKQVAGFAPNFIHSVDSTHMLMAARRCRNEGVTFAGRHDAYGTHAAHQPRLAKITRETFVELHSRPVLSELAAELRARNAGVVISDPPPPGTLDVSRALGADYLFG